MWPLAQSLKTSCFCLFSQVGRCSFLCISLIKGKGVRWLSLTMCPRNRMSVNSKNDYITECGCRGPGHIFVIPILYVWRDRVSSLFLWERRLGWKAGAPGSEPALSGCFATQPLMTSLAERDQHLCSSRKDPWHSQGLGWGNRVWWGWRGGHSQGTKRSAFSFIGAQHELSSPRLPPIHTDCFPFPLQAARLAVVQTGFLVCQTNSQGSGGRRTPLGVTWPHLWFWGGTWVASPGASWLVITPP